jgi:hypothetical protein
MAMLQGKRLQKSKYECIQWFQILLFPDPFCFSNYLSWFLRWICNAFTCCWISNLFCFFFFLIPVLYYLWIVLALFLFLFPLSIICVLVFVVVLFVFVFVWDRVFLCSSSWPRTHSLLTQLPKCWDYRDEPHPPHKCFNKTISRIEFKILIQRNATIFSKSYATLMRQMYPHACVYLRLNVK